MSGEVLSRMAQGTALGKIHIGSSEEGNFTYNFLDS
jgi:hypothetical protein